MTYFSSAMKKIMSNLGVGTRTTQRRLGGASAVDGARACMARGDGDVAAEGQAERPARRLAR